MVQFWKAWRNNFLPDSGGYGEQSARMIEAFEILEGAYQREKKEERGHG